jgi:hypothetical protein
VRPRAPGGRTHAGAPVLRPDRWRGRVLHDQRPRRHRSHAVARRLASGLDQDRPRQLRRRRLHRPAVLRASAGTGEFYTTDSRGRIRLLKQHTGWRSSWTDIIPGNFGGNGFTDLLFYDAAAGTGEFYTTDGQGGIRQLALHTNWRTSWTQIVPGNFGGNGFTDLLFYEAPSGTGEFYATNGQGGISQLALHTNWRSSWTRIIPGNFGGNGFTDQRPGRHLAPAYAHVRRHWS